MRRGYKYPGRHAARNRLIFKSFELGVSAKDLATAWKLSRGRIWQIIAAGNGGSMRAPYLDEAYGA
jgi:Mor family transcriptional regulator